MIRRIAIAAALFAAIFPGPLFAQARSEATVLMSTNPQARQDQEKYGYSDAVIAGDMIFLSGIVVGQAPGETDLAPAFDRVFRHIDRILNRAGASLDDVVDMTSFHTDIAAQISPMAEAAKRHLKSPPPAWTAIDVDRLLPDRGIAEIKVVARKSGAAKQDQ